METLNAFTAKKLVSCCSRSRGKILISAPGTSCRHQIKDGTGKQALHPVEVLYDALNH